MYILRWIFTINITICGQLLSFVLFWLANGIRVIPTENLQAKLNLVSQYARPTLTKEHIVAWYMGTLFFFSSFFVVVVVVVVKSDCSLGENSLFLCQSAVFGATCRSACMGAETMFTKH